MKRIAGLALILSIFWLINSWHFTPLLLSLGVASVIAIVLLSLRMEKVDGSFEPAVLMTYRLPAYLFWLLIEIIKTNIDVVRRIWLGQGTISPTIVRVKASQKTDICRVLYANSITMTPGTVTLDIDGDMLEVHALTREGAVDLELGEMDRRVTRLEGNS